MTVAEMYRLLELKEGAGPAEVKKAYFRLIRKFPPEKDPEAFQQLRKAYEALKDGPPKDQKNKPDWVTWKSPIVGYMLELADQYEEREEYDKACDLMADTLKIEPDNVLLHLLMARYQMYGGHPQLAAKDAEYVTKHLPDNREGWMLMANGYQNRGWYKKAYPAFEKAYELGCRDTAFLLERITNLAQNGRLEEANDLYRQYTETTPCNDSTREYLMEAYYRWAEIIPSSTDSIEVFLRRFEQLMQKAGQKTDPCFSLSVLNQLIAERTDVIREKENRQRLRETAQRLTERDLIPKEISAECIGAITLLGIQKHPAILQPAWGDLYKIITPVLEDDPGLRQFVETDAMLCLITNAEQTKKEIPLIREEFPDLAEKYASFLEAVEKDETEALLRKLQWQFNRLSDKYTGSRYEAMMGAPKANREQRRWSRQEAQDDLFDFPDEEIDEPYIREKEKVGRNDPCPCGSGKKFKKCCMGKGLYD